MVVAGAETADEAACRSALSSDNQSLPEVINALVRIGFAAMTNWYDPM